MTAALVSLGVFVTMLVAVVVFVSRRDRRRVSSDEDSTAARHADTDQRRHESERHFATGMAASRHMPNSI